MANAAIVYDNAVNTSLELKKNTNVKRHVEQQFSIRRTNYGEKGAYTSDRRQGTQKINSSTTSWNTTKTQVRLTAAHVATSQLTARRIMREGNIRPWKYQLVLEITEEDFDRRLQFAE